jgi:choline kinase
LRLGIDRHLDSDAVDLDDVTCVRTDGGDGAGDGAGGARIVAIGKGLSGYDAFDTGVFAVGPAFYAALAGLDRPSITEGVRVLAAAGTALAIDVGTLGWVDVDDPPALALAERQMGHTVAATAFGPARLHRRPLASKR